MWMINRIIATPLVWGLLPLQRFLPAFPILIFFWSGLETTPIVAVHELFTFLVSPDDNLSIACCQSYPDKITEEPADLASFPPLPGISSTLCIDVPGGISFSSKAFPTLISTSLPDSILSPCFKP